MKQELVILALCVASLCAALKVPVVNERPHQSSNALKPQAPAPIPGADLLGTGFSALTGQSNLLPIFDFKYATGKTWSPAYAPTVTYSVPDEISVSLKGETDEVIVENIYEDYQAFLSYYSSYYHFSFGIELGIFGLGFKYNHELMRVHQEMSNNTMAEGHSRHWWSLYQVTALPAFMQTLDSSFTATIQGLPATIKSSADAAKYAEMFQYFGTHYVARAEYGAYAHMDTFVSQAFASKMSLQWTATQMSLSFHYYFYAISGGGFHNRSQINIDKTFALNSASYYFFQGGDPTLASVNSLDQWVASIPLQPAMVNCTLIPLAELVSDPTMKATMTTATASYIKNQGVVSLIDF